MIIIIHSTHSSVRPLSMRGQSLFMHPALCLQDKAEIKVKLGHLDYARSCNAT